MIHSVRLSGEHLAHHIDSLGIMRFVFVYQQTRIAQSVKSLAVYSMAKVWFLARARIFVSED
jgi:hypothetical protein